MILTGTIMLFFETFIGRYQWTFFFWEQFHANDTKKGANGTRTIKWITGYAIIKSRKTSLKTTPQYRAVQEYFQKPLFGYRWERRCLSLRLSSLCARTGFPRTRCFLARLPMRWANIRGENRSLLCTVNNGRHAAEPANSVGMFVRTLLQGGSRRLESPAHQPAGDQ